MAITQIHFVNQWDTFHQNGPFPAKMLLNTELESSHAIPALLDRYNDAAIEIRRLLEDAIAQHERFRACGSAWSLNNIAHQKDRMHFNTSMNIKMTLEQEDMHPGSSFGRDDLFFFQCGNTIKEISKFLFGKKKSLKTSGASNGQTIAGAISTGIHGSALDVGSVQDSVVGINLITGPGADDVVYIERHTKPALSNAFSAKIKSRVIRNDGLFNAALVSLGSFGFIHGVIIETEDLFLLKRYVKRITKSQALELSEQMNFESSSFRIAAETDAGGVPLKPYHFKLYINPYNKDEDYIAEVIYKKEYQPGYPDPIPAIKTAIYKELPDFMACLAAKHNWAIPRILNAMKGTLFPEPDSEITGTLGEIFWDSIHRGPAFACTMGIDNKQTGKALELFIDLVNTEGPVPGAIAIRFVKASEATLAFTKYPVTCILEMDGTLWKGNERMISIEQFTRRIIEVLMAAGIEFTIHWGKNASWSFPGLADYMYGNRKDTWMKFRSALLTAQTADLFSNDFLDTIQLSGYLPGSDPGLIASMDINGNPEGHS